MATQDYVLWLDADDIVLPADAEKFNAIVSNLEWNTDAVSMYYNLAFDDAGNVTMSLRRNRLVKRGRGFRWIGMVHEYLEVNGLVVCSDICITHDKKHTNSTRNRERAYLTWGSNDMGQLGNGSTVGTTSPVFKQVQRRLHN